MKLLSVRWLAGPAWTEGDSVCIGERGALGGLPTSHLPGTGKHSWDAVFNAMNLTLLFLDAAHQIPISPSVKENDKIIGL